VIGGAATVISKPLQSRRTANTGQNLPDRDAFKLHHDDMRVRFVVPLLELDYLRHHSLLLAGGLQRVF